MMGIFDNYSNGKKVFEFLHGDYILSAWSYERNAIEQNAQTLLRFELLTHQGKVLSELEVLAIAAPPHTSDEERKLIATKMIAEIATHSRSTAKEKAPQAKRRKK